MRHSTRPPEHADSGLAGALTLGVVGALATATLTVATGHGLRLALAAYTLTGAFLLIAGAAGRLPANATVATRSCVAAESQPS